MRVGDGFTGYSVLTHLVGATLLEKGGVEISLQLRAHVHAVVSVFAEAIVNFLV